MVSSPGALEIAFGVNRENALAVFAVGLFPIEVELAVLFQLAFDRAGELARILAGEGSVFPLFDHEQTPVGVPRFRERRILSEKRSD